LRWRALHPGEVAYPRLLGEIPEPPTLAVAGELPADGGYVAIVGSRNASPYGEEMAHRLAASLAAAGLVVVSGLARGIDAAAHRGALDGGGQTVAVMGTGPDTIYPARHASLARRIASRGALVTQFPPDTPPLPHNFPLRNRTISGLSLGVVVVEALCRSGAMLTAGSAGDQGRVVMALPGSVHNPNSEGCHALIRDGARLVTGAADVLAELSIDPLWGLAQDPRVAPTTPAFHDLRDSVLKLLLSRPLTLEQLCERLRTPAGEVAAAAARLRLDELVALHDGRYHALRKG
jgi:DNA processing protein